MTGFLYRDLSYSIIGAAIEVHRQLGPGFLEGVYKKALAHELNLKRLTFLAEVPLEVEYKGIQVGKYFADLVVDGKSCWRSRQRAHWYPGTTLKLSTI